MKIYIITPENDLPDEIDCISELAREGVRVHIRKKSKTDEELMRFIGQIQESARVNLSIHGNHPIALDMGLGGLHLSAAENEIKLENWSGLISKSLHDLKELDDVKNNGFNYCFLSPVFDSISKEGYRSGFELTKLSEKLNSRQTDFPVIALGGVSLNRLDEIKEANFDGAAILGDFWNLTSLKNRLEYIRKLKQYIND